MLFAEILRHFRASGVLLAAAAKQEPANAVVVFTGISLVFAILVLLVLVLLLEGKIFSAIDKRKAEKAEAEKKTASPAVTPASPVVQASAPAPVVQQGIPAEVVAAIAAAVAEIEGGKYTLRSVQTSQKGRGQWGLAGIIASTEPF